jgi:hypothetical protein
MGTGGWVALVVVLVAVTGVGVFLATRPEPSSGGSSGGSGGTSPNINPPPANDQSGNVLGLLTAAIGAAGTIGGAVAQSGRQPVPGTGYGNNTGV